MMRNLYTKHSTQTTWIIISGNENNKQCNTSRQTSVVMQTAMIIVAAFKHNCKFISRHSFASGENSPEH